MVAVFAEEASRRRTPGSLILFLPLFSLLSHQSLIAIYPGHRSVIASFRPGLPPIRRRRRLIYLLPTVTAKLVFGVPRSPKSPQLGHVIRPRHLLPSTTN